MLESEPYDNQTHDIAAGGRGTGELSPSPPSVPAAVFQPPQVVFQPPTVRTESARTEPASQPEVPRSAGASGGADSPGDSGDDDGSGPGRRRRRRPSRSRAQAGEQDAAGADGDDTQEKDGQA